MIRADEQAGGEALVCLDVEPLAGLAPWSFNRRAISEYDITGHTQFIPPVKDPCPNLRRGICSSENLDRFIACLLIQETS